MAIANDRLEALKARINLVEYIDFDDPDEEDLIFVAEVKRALTQRDLTLDELANLRKPHVERANAERKARMDRRLQQRSVGPHNKLYSVANRSQMRIDVIAMDVATAQEFAARAGHVRDADNATVYRYNDDHIEKLMKDGSALGRAVREGVPGVVERRGKNVIVGDRVFTPMSVV